MRGGNDPGAGGIDVIVGRCRAQKLNLRLFLLKTSSAAENLGFSFDSNRLELLYTYGWSLQEATREQDDVIFGSDSPVPLATKSFPSFASIYLACVLRATSSRGKQPDFLNYRTSGSGQERTSGDITKKVCSWG